MKKILSLIMLLVAIVTGAWADTETIGFNTVTAKNVTVTKTSVTLNGSTYVAGNGATQSTGMSDKGIKLRTNQTNVTISETKYNTIVFTVNPGYKVTAFTMVAGSNDSSKDVTATGLYVDDNTSTNYLSSNVTMTNATAGTVSGSNLNAETNIIIAFATTSHTQINADITITYEQTATLYTATFANGGHGTAPSTQSNVLAVTLPTIGADWYKNNGWTANQNVTVGGETVTAGTTIACGATATLAANTTFTAQWEDSDFPYITGVTLPAAPSETFNLSTQTTFNPTDGYVVQKMQTLRNGSYSWMSVNQGGSASGQQWTAPEGSVFISESTAESVTALMATKKNYAIQFTGTTEIQALMNSRNNNYSVHALLVDRTNKTYTIEDISSTTGDSSDPELTSANIATFSDLNPSHTYVVFFYGYNDSGNGLVYEVAFKAPSETVKTNAGKWASYTPSFNVTLEDGAEAYYITSIGAGGQLDGEAVTTLKAGEGYFVKGAEASHTYTATYSTADADATDGNMLVGCTESTTLEAGYTPYRYFLGTDSSTGKAGLFYVGSTAITIPAGKCYLQTGANAPLSLTLPFEEVTAISNVEANADVNSAAPVKVIKNGKLYIGNYNVVGQLVK